MAKKTLLIFQLLIFLGSTYAQTPNWEWGRGAGGPDWEAGYRIAADGNGNTVVTGRFKSPSITFGSYTITGFYNENTFIAKYDPFGNVLWAQSLLGYTSDNGWCDVAVDRDDNIVITGTFSGPTMTFGSYTLINSGVGDIFIAKFDSSGNVLWARRAGSDRQDNGYCITTDVNNNVIVSGGFNSNTISFGPFTLTNAETSGFTQDVFIVKYDAWGNVIWAKGAGGKLGDQGNGIASDENGNIVLTGEFVSDTIAFGSFILHNADTIGSSPDIFIIQYDSLGNEQWAKGIRGNWLDRSGGVTSDEDNNYILTGWFLSDTLYFDTQIIVHSGSYNMFISKFSSSGTEIWSGKVNSSLCVPRDIATYEGRNVVITGRFGEMAVFGSDTLSNPLLINAFVCKYDATGNAVWGICPKKPDLSAEGWGIISDQDNNIIVCGLFTSSSLIFGWDTLSNNSINNGHDVFIAKLGSPLVGINSDELSEYPSIYPNPARDIIKFEISQISKNAIISIYNIEGALLKTRMTDDVKSEIDISYFKPGLYFIKVNTEKCIWVMKFIKT